MKWFAICLLCLVGGAMARAAEPVNRWCPVTPIEPADAKYTVPFEGKTVGLCCRSCVRKFQVNPETYRAQLTHDAPPQLDRKPELRARIWRLLGNLHVVLVHFPIAFLILAAACEGASAFFWAEKFAFASRLNFVAGESAGVVSAAFGWIAATDMPAVAVRNHQTLGTLVAGVCVIGLASLLAERANLAAGSQIYRWAVFLAALLTVGSAHTGGILVHGADHLTL